MPPDLPRGHGERAPFVLRPVASVRRRSARLCKRIANNLRLPLLVEAFPGATFVQLTRDGRVSRPCAR